MDYSQQATDPMDSPTQSRAPSPRKCYRRRSVADESLRTQIYMQEKLEVLTGLWDDVSMKEDDRVARLHTAYGHIRNLIDQMVESEQTMVQEVKEYIEDGTEKITSMREELGLSLWESRQPCNSIALKKEVEKEMQLLTQKYEARRKEQDEVVEQLDSLCLRLGKNVMEHLPDAEKKLLPRSELTRLTSIVDDLKTELDTRREKALQWQHELRNWCRHLGRAYGDHDEAALKAFLEEDINGDNFLLTNPIMERIEQFWTELAGMHTSWVQDMDIEWMTHYEELKELWEQCHYGDADRQFPSRFDPDLHSQDDIDAMSEEVRKLKRLFADREPVYKVIAQWKEAWKQKLDLEEMKKDPNYYQSRDRSHNIMRDAQYERHLNEVKLPNLKKSIKTAYDGYKASHPDDRICMEGYEPVAYVEWMESEYKLIKETERSAKIAMKKTLVTTPQSLKSRIGARTPAGPSHIPAKQQKLAMEAHISIITPTRAQNPGPKTSSPKEVPGSTPSTPKRVVTPLRKRNP